MNTTRDTATAQATLPFAGDATAILRAAVRAARQDAAAGGRRPRTVITGIGHLVDALAPGTDLAGLRPAALQADRALARVLRSAEVRARADGAATVTLAHVRAALDARLRHAGTTVARVGYGRFLARRAATGQGLAPGDLARRTGEGTVSVNGLATPPTPEDLDDTPF